MVPSCHQIITLSPLETLYAFQHHDNIHLLPKDPDIVNIYKHTMYSWKERRESTATYGHHIVQFQATTKHTFLSWIIFQRGDIPAISGYSSKQHKLYLDLMMLKKAQTYELKTQRTLGSLDKEFNNNNRVIGKMAEEHTCFEQHY